MARHLKDWWISKFSDLNDQPAFSALCYPGFLPGNAFGFNAAGVMHTVNHVAPHPVEIGLSRHFSARSLLDAGSLDEEKLGDVVLRVD
jgi:hypothetical protein